MNLKELKNASIHFIGVGGIGMSGIAQLLVHRGFRVSGSDMFSNSNTERLKKAGLPIMLGHEVSNLDGKDIVVVSTDIKEDNAELIEAHARDLPVFHRADMLALVMEESYGIAISGTHGKTTTTALMGWVLETANFDPTVINGGLMNNWESNIKVGQSVWCVAEADESDASFLKLPRDIALVTNMDLDHMDYYEHTETLYNAFETFTTHIRPGGVAVLGIDHPQVYTLWQKIKLQQKCITYGLHAEADIKAENIRTTPEGSIFDLVTGQTTPDMFIPLPGHHNVLNALGVAAIALECGVTAEDLKRGFSSFKGVQRRFTYVGKWQGVTIIDDYAHHPVEIRATLTAAKGAANGRVIAVLEPHRYSRLANHFQEFATSCEEADLTIVLPVYGAREVPQTGIHHEALVEAMKGNVHRCDHPENLPQLIRQLALSGDMVICLGAGSISALAHALPNQLNQLNKQNVT
ncbi:MAG: UDP-N-acetylmuramate--L-alanine ligase [Alphaproteobacteria bacterium]|nr:UDP-N-acetylmuramate--L-alanine ligase [Alphaproteobacteria bacterium]